jgi:hypothetical protein
MGHDCAGAVFSHQQLVCDPGHLCDIKRKGVQGGQDFIEI